MGLKSQTSIVLSDIFDQELGRASFDSALIGFFLSHLTDMQERVFFAKLRSILKPTGRFLILDSVWSEERAKTRQKQGIQERFLNDGRRFEIYKKYLDQDDIILMEKKHDLNANIEHLGRVFLAVSGTFRVG